MKNKESVKYAALTYASFHVTMAVITMATSTSTMLPMIPPTSAPMFPVTGPAGRIYAVTVLFLLSYSLITLFWSDIMIETVMWKWLILRNWKDSIQSQCYGSAVNGLGMTSQWRLWTGTKFLPVLPATSTQVGTCPDQLPLWRQEITVFPEMLPPLLQENCTVIPGALEDVFVMMLAGVDRWLHRTKEEEYMQ